MQVTIDISRYPNREDQIRINVLLIELINFTDLKISTFPTSTVAQGEYNHAMQAVQKPLLSATRNIIGLSYVEKIIPDYKALN